MSDKQNPSLDEDESLPAREEESRDQSGSAPKSYYYDDSTGYEIYNEETDTDEEAEEPDEEGR
jgi:hypothetical protein